MDLNNLKYLLYVVIGVIIIHFLYNLIFTGGNVRRTLDELQKIEKELNTTSKSLQDAQRQTDSLQARLVRYEFYINDIQKSVELLELDRRLKTSRFNSEKDSIQKVIKTLEKQIDTTRSQLPEIIVEF